MKKKERDTSSSSIFFISFSFCFDWQGTGLWVPTINPYLQFFCPPQLSIKDVLLGTWPMQIEDNTFFHPSISLTALKCMGSCFNSAFSCVSVLHWRQIAQMFAQVSFWSPERTECGDGQSWSTFLDQSVIYIVSRFYFPCCTPVLPPTPCPPLPQEAKLSREKFSAWGEWVCSVWKVFCSEPSEQPSTYASSSLVN